MFINNLYCKFSFILRLRKRRRFAKNVQNPKSRVGCAGHMWDGWDGNPTNDCSHCQSGEDEDEDEDAIDDEHVDPGDFEASGVGESAEPSSLEPVEGAQSPIREFALPMMMTMMTASCIVSIEQKAPCLVVVDFQLNSTN